VKQINFKYEVKGRWSDRWWVRSWGLWWGDACGKRWTRRTVNRMRLTQWRRELIPQVRWCILLTSSGGARCLKVVVHEKLDLPEAFHERRMHEFGGEYGRRRGPFFPQKKIEFVIGGDAISRCLDWLTCTVQSLLSRYSITFSSHRHYKQEAKLSLG